MNVPQVQTDAIDPTEVDERRLPTLQDLDALVAELDELDRRLDDVDD